MEFKNLLKKNKMKKDTTNLILLAAVGFIAYKFLSKKDEEQESEPQLEPIVGADVPGCTDAQALNYNEDATLDDGSCTYEDVIEQITSQPGCTDPLASNYNPDATVMNDSCIYVDDIDPITNLTTDELAIKSDIEQIITLPSEQGGLGLSTIEAYNYMSPYYADYVTLDGNAIDVSQPVFMQLAAAFGNDPSGINDSLVPPSQWVEQDCHNPFLCVVNDYDGLVEQLGY